MFLHFCPIFQLFVSFILHLELITGLRFPDHYFILQLFPLLNHLSNFLFQWFHFCIIRSYNFFFRRGNILSLSVWICSKLTLNCSVYSINAFSWCSFIFLDAPLSSCWHSEFGNYKLFAHICILKFLMHSEDVRSDDSDLSLVIWAVVWELVGIGGSIGLPC